VIHVALELPPGAGRAFVFNAGQMFGVTLREDHARGIALVRLQSGGFGTATIEDVRRGEIDVERFRVE
jgi:hypothetical protein